MQQINLKEKSTVELKALAFDLLSEQQYINNNLQVVNNEINLRLEEEKKQRLKTLQESQESLPAKEVSL